MKITSSQITIGLGIVGVLAVYFVGKKAIGAAGNAAASVGEAVAYGVQQITPWNPENVFYRGTSGLVDAVAADGRSAPLGVRLWEWMNPDKVAAENALIGPVQRKSIAEPAAWTAGSTGGATGGWGDDPAAIQYGDTATYVNGA